MGVQWLEQATLQKVLLVKTLSGEAEQQMRQTETRVRVMGNFRVGGRNQEHFEWAGN